MRPGLIETADSKEEAETLQTWWAGEVVLAGLTDTHGVNIRPVPLSHGVCWGIFLEPHDDDNPEAQETVKPEC
jgi:hypothetical protein